MEVDRRDLVGGLALAVLGAAFAWGALDLPLGTARRMGPGYLPLVVAGIAILLGLLIAVSALGRAGRIPPIEWRPFLGVLAGLAAFGIAVRPLGLLPAIVLAVLASATADARSRPLPALALALFLAGAAHLVFIVGLRLPLVPWRVPF